MAKNDLKEMTPQELAAKGRELREEMFNLRLQQATARLEKTHRVRQLRRDVARCETLINQSRKKS
jgi:large subunit ribosomal protein L29